nr:MAG TPA: hypothetical protein [Bacteriophage sp.]
MYFRCPDRHGRSSRLPACLILHWLPNITINVTPSPISFQSIDSVVFFNVICSFASFPSVTILNLFTQLGKQYNRRKK